jgi:hypothetical protein
MALTVEENHEVCRPKCNGKEFDDLYTPLHGKYVYSLGTLLSAAKTQQAFRAIN